MSRASANSSMTSNKEVEIDFGWKPSGGNFGITKDEKYIEMEEKNTVDKKVQLFEIVEKSVGTFVKDPKNPNVRIDVKTGTKYVKGSDGKIKVVRRQRKQDEQDR